MILKFKIKVRLL